MDRVTRFRATDGNVAFQLVTHDATATENAVISVAVGEAVDVYAEAQRRGYEIVHPLTTEPWGIRRFLARAPDARPCHTGAMTDWTDPKTVLRRYLQEAREALLLKLEGLGERDLRLPRTPTGTNLLGIVKHCLNVEIGYFGPTFGREWPSPGEIVSAEALDADPQADWYATAEETAAGIIDLYRRVWAFADETIRTLPLDAPGHVPWWSEQHRQVTLQRILVHVVAELARHAGQADILREHIDGAIGLRRQGDNIPDIDWTSYVDRLTALAER